MTLQTLYFNIYIIYDVIFEGIFFSEDELSIFLITNITTKFIFNIFNHLLSVTVTFRHPYAIIRLKKQNLSYILIKFLHYKIWPWKTLFLEFNILFLFVLYISSSWTILIVIQFYFIFYFFSLNTSTNNRTHNQLTTIKYTHIYITLVELYL